MKLNCRKCDKETDLEIESSSICSSCLEIRTRKTFIKYMSKGLDTKRHKIAKTTRIRIMVAYNKSLASVCCEKLIKEYTLPQIEEILYCGLHVDYNHPKFISIQKEMDLEMAILDTAYKHDCNVILYCHDSHHLASKLLTRVVLGKAKGIEVFENGCTTAYKDKEFKIIYPFQNCYFNELLNYASIHHLPFLPTKSTTSTDFYDITKNFLLLQEKEKSSTCSTINRTLAKVNTL